MTSNIYDDFHRLRYRLLQGLSLFLVPIALVLAIVNVYMEAYSVAGVEFLMACTSAFVYWHLKQGHLTFAYSLIIPLFLVLTIMYVTWAKGAPERMYLWIFIFPPLFYFLFSGFYGFYLSLVVGVSQGAIIFLRSTPDLFEAFLKDINFSLAYLSIWVLSHFYEANRCRTERALKEFAVRDPLTNLHNRFSLRESFIHITRQDNPFSLVLIDLDNFKLINDTYGHEAGDLVLKSFAALLQAEIGNEEVFHISRESVFRVGGEEFALLLHGDANKAHRISEKVRQRAENSPVLYEDTTIHYSMSAGIHEYQDRDTLSDMLKEADIKLYSAKEAGRNQVCI